LFFNSKLRVQNAELGPWSEVGVFPFPWGRPRIAGPVVGKSPRCFSWGFHGKTSIRELTRALLDPHRVQAIPKKRWARDRCTAGIIELVYYGQAAKTDKFPVATDSVASNPFTARHVRAPYLSVSFRLTISPFNARRRTRNRNRDALRGARRPTRCVRCAVRAGL